MSAAIPDGLRQPELVRYLLRANQLRQIKPAISYWCEYYVLDQIISRQLHTADQDCLAWTTALMDRLEQTKTENADNDTITDDTAGQAYVEQFAQQAFERGERVLRANKVTKQTAETFDAAATFFSLAKVWGPIDEETRQKILFCKWNAARILKALRAGEDPNDSNPALDDPVPISEDDDNLGAGEAAPASESTPVQRPPPPTVQDADDDGDIALPNAPDLPSVPDLPSAPVLPSVPHGVAPRVLDVPAIDPPSPLSVTEDMPAWQGGVSAAVSPTVPTTPGVPGAGTSISPQISPVQGDFSGNNAGFTGHSTTNNSSHNATNLSGRNASPPDVSSVLPSTFSPPRAPFVPAPTPASAPTPTPASTTSVPVPVSTSTSASASTPTPTWQPPKNHSFSADEADLAKAQKHAKWAISALNFEDVPTAVKELRNALAALGGL
ncbi:hypothetical protein TD95_002907 [Thielaviopsis punctulata]|uniref:Vta1 C-terminal domain-containing protein n=1 Tax=Thielaviopsis punctulata TaxID=72032 RepID=A0A0F4ZD78_9PEZI|nr:hypothetical protein TD95_002907 [Thielaviopsis punctulata]